MKGSKTGYCLKWIGALLLRGFLEYSLHEESYSEENLLKDCNVFIELEEINERLMKSRSVARLQGVD